MLGMYVPKVDNRGTFAAGIVGLATSIGIAYGKELFGLEQNVSFTWIQPCGLLSTLVVGLALSPLGRSTKPRPELLWFRGRDN
jgi:hypothetical protein